jgi:hypothetical protein
MSTKSVKRRVAPLEHVVRPEGHVAQGKHNEVSGTLGARSAHVAQGKHNEASGTLGAPSVS